MPFRRALILLVRDARGRATAQQLRVNTRAPGALAGPFAEGSYSPKHPVLGKTNANENKRWPVVVAGLLDGVRLCTAVSNGEIPWKSGSGTGGRGPQAFADLYAL